MKYLNEERFIVNSNDKDARRRYNENYDRVFSEEVVAKALEPNLSAVVSEHTVRDPDTGVEIDVTRHEDGSVTVVRERLVCDCGASHVPDECPHWPDCELLCTEGARCNCGRDFDK